MSQQKSSKELLPEYTYYYGFSKDDVLSMHTMLHIEALEFRKRAAKALLTTLVNCDFMLQDTARINDVGKAIKHNQKLLNELEL